MTLRLIGSCAAAAALTSLAQAQVTLLAHYELNETTGTTANDSSGNGYHGTYMNGVTLGQPGAGAGSGNAALFDGATGYVAIPGNAAFDALSADFSIAAWGNVNILQLQRVFSNERITFANPGSFSFGTTGNGLRFTTLGVQDYDQAASVVAGQWHHLAITFDSSFTASFYLDGMLVGQVAGGAPAAAPSAANRYVIGVLDSTGATVSEWWDGLIDDVQVYSGTLSAMDIAFLHANPGAAIGGTLGTSYCGPAVANSTGSPATISADGSALVTDDDVTLIADDLPMNSFGFFLTSQTQGFVANPGGSSGNLCSAAPSGASSARVRSRTPVPPARSTSLSPSRRSRHRRASSRCRAARLELPVLVPRLGDGDGHEQLHRRDRDHLPVI